ncbi:MAG: hypothetical protein GX295_09485 [Syntrophomonadaceae bacterium]|nr:hypothetical protein [Syntrophomonadaceae bacterium]
MNQSVNQFLTKLYPEGSRPPDVVIILNHQCAECQGQRLDLNLNQTKPELTRDNKVPVKNEIMKAEAKKDAPEADEEKTPVDQVNQVTLNLEDKVNEAPDNLQSTQKETVLTNACTVQKPKITPNLAYPCFLHNNTHLIINKNISANQNKLVQFSYKNFNL